MLQCPISKGFTRFADRVGMRKITFLMTLCGLSLLLVSCNPEDCSVNPDAPGCEVSDDPGATPDPSPAPTPDNPPNDPDVPSEPDEPEEPQEPQDPQDPNPRDPASEFSWLEVSDHVADVVDPKNGNDELSLRRTVEDFSRGDSCHADLDGQLRFADSIGFFINELSKEQKVQLQGIASFYNMSSNDANYFPVSLISHPLCRVTRTSLNSTIRNVPGNTTIALAQRFADDHNRYRQQALEGSAQGKEDLLKLWGEFFGCLAYSESLSTADTSLSSRTASRYAPSGYRKPAGVKFYDDPAQNEASRLNIGLFQFTPNYSGNINPCFRQWNRDYPECSISRGDRSSMIRVVGSSLQHFNAYCGVHKLLQTFSVQVNSSSTRNTHPDNRSGSSLKPASQRCVTPHFYAGWAYNHFGPLQNSTGSNLNKLLKCVYSE